MKVKIARILPSPPTSPTSPTGSTPAASPTPYRLDFGGRARFEADGRWVYHRVEYGHASAEMMQSAGSGADPVILPRALGHIVRAGHRVTGALLHGYCRPYSVEVRLYFLNFDAGNVLPDPANFTLVGQGTGLFNQPDEVMFHEASVDWTAPCNGVLIPVLRPETAPAARDYFSFTGVIEMEAPSA